MSLSNNVIQKNGQQLQDDVVIFVVFLFVFIKPITSIWPNYLECCQYHAHVLQALFHLC